MADVELRLTADAAQAIKSISGFRQEYRDLIKAIEKPLSQIDALQKTQESAKGAAAEFFAAKRRVDELKTAISAAGQPVKSLDRDLAKAERSLTRSTQAFERQKAAVKQQRAELRAAGVDYRNLAGEQARLQSALGEAVGKGGADAALSQTLDTLGITKLRNLRAQLTALQSDYKRLTQSGVLSASERASAEIRYQAQLNQTKKAIQEITVAGAQDGGGISGISARLAGIVAAAYSVEQVGAYFFSTADAVGELEDRMRNALPVQAEYEQAQARLEEISKRVRIPIEQASELYLGSVGPLKEMGFSAAATADMVAALSAGFVANSVKGERAAAAIDQINKGLQTGVIRGDAFNAILQNSPALTDALTKGLGVTRAELIRMANAGDLTTEKFVTALASQSEALLKLADAMRVTTGDAAGTFRNSLGRVIGSIDKLLNVSKITVGELDRLSGALDKVAKGDFKGFGEWFAEAGLEKSGIPGHALVAMYRAYQDWQGKTTEALDDVATAEQEAKDKAKATEEGRLAEMRAYATSFNGVQEDLTNKFKDALTDQVAAQTKANSALTKARNAQLETAKRYKDAFEKLNSAGSGPASYNNAQTLEVASRNALKSGDIETAKKKAKAALDMLLELQDAGANTYGFAGMAKSLQQIEQEADKISVEKAEKSLQAARDKTREWKKEFEELKDFKITPNIDDAALAAATQKMKDWAAMIGKEVTIEPRNLTPEASKPSGATGDWGGVTGDWSEPAGAAGAAGKAATVPVELKPTAIAPTDLPPVEVAVKPTGIRQDGPNSFTNLPPVDVQVRPTGIRQDGENSWTNLPAVPVDVIPKGIRQDGENSFTNLPPIEVEVLPKGIRKDGENSFTNLPPVDVGVQVDQQAVATAQQAVTELAQHFTQQMQIPVVPLVQAPTGATVPAPGATGSYAVGGWTGPGSKYMPAGIVHADEHVQPKRVVNEPGALPFLEQIRRNGFRNTISQLQARMAQNLRGYAEGGLVAPRNLPIIPSISPALAAAASGGGDVESWGTLALELGGKTYNVKASRSTAEDLRIEALKFGRTHRK